ncbi:hypothetical protein [Thiorhodococcus fuscus]|uniref:Uncharacterized protein n=1 Tax=Thiorhodococcus fuscus TaxID=527200 RepID=A0ABW4Y8K7_9GAMM
MTISVARYRNAPIGSPEFVEEGQRIGDLKDRDRRTIHIATVQTLRNRMTDAERRELDDLIDGVIDRQYPED